MKLLFLKSDKQGQTVLIVILIMAIGLTIGLALFLQSLSNVTLTKTEEQSERAFSAAQAGVEDILSKDFITLTSLGSSYSVDVTANLSAKINLDNVNEFQKEIEQNGVAFVQLLGTVGLANRLVIRWVSMLPEDVAQRPATCAEGNASAPASIIIDRWYKDISGQTNIRSYGYNASRADCAALTNGLTQALSSSDSNYMNEIIIGQTDPIDYDQSDGSYDIGLRIRPIYNLTDLYVGSAVLGVNIPIQAVNVTSTSTIPGSYETRSIDIQRTVDDLPEIFDYVLFSGEDLVKPG